MLRNKHPVLVGATLREGESQEKLIRRFFKKCKKQEIMKEYLEKVSYCRSKSRKKRDKILKNKHRRRVEESRFEKKNS